MLYSNRVVIHPDFCGLGLSMKFVNATARIMAERGFRIRAKFSSEPMRQLRKKDPNWKLIKKSRDFLKQPEGSIKRRSKEYTARRQVTAYTYEFRPASVSGSKA